MIVRGTWDWNLIRIETDSGLYGIGEAYWGWGVKDLVVNKMKGIIVGEDPLNVDKLYTKMLMESAGAGAIGGATVTAASGIEIALWDLAGRILETPSCNLLGGRFRDKVRFYRTTQVPVEHPEDLASWRDLVRRTRAEPWGWTAFKFQGDGIPRAMDPQYKQPGHDRYLRNLNHGDIVQIVKVMETVREELGPQGDFAIDLHWHYDVRDAIDLANALAPVKPMWIEDPTPPENPETWPWFASTLPCRSVQARIYTASRDSRSSSSCRAATAFTLTFQNREVCWNRNASPTSPPAMAFGPPRTIQPAPWAPSPQRMQRRPCATSAFTSWRNGSTGGPIWSFTKVPSGRTVT